MSQDDLHQAEQEDLTLVDRWEQLGAEHQLTESMHHDPWPRSTCWTRFTSGCTCGAKYPAISATEAEIRNSAHLLSWRQTHSHAEHLKHLVSLLLDEDWMLWDDVLAGWIPIEQA